MSMIHWRPFEELVITKMYASGAFLGLLLLLSPFFVMSQEQKRTISQKSKSDYAVKKPVSKKSDAQANKSTKEKEIAFYDAVVSVAFSPNNHLLGIVVRSRPGKEGQELRDFDIETKEEGKIIAGCPEFSPIAFSPVESMKIMATCNNDFSEDCFTYYLDLKRDKTNVGLRKFPLIGQQDINSIAFSKNGKLLAMGSSDGGLDTTVRIWDVETQKVISKKHIGNGLVNGVGFSPDEKLVFIACGGKIKIWNVAQKEIERSFSCDQINNRQSAKFSSDGKYAVTGSGNNAKIWDMATGTMKKTLVGHKGLIHSIALSADGKLLATGSEDKTVKLWNVHTGHLKQTFTGHKNRVNCVAFSANGKMIASGSDDKTVKIWFIK